MRYGTDYSASDGKTAAVCTFNGEIYIFLARQLMNQVHNRTPLFPPYMAKNCQNLQRVWIWKQHISKFENIRFFSTARSAWHISA